MIDKILAVWGLLMAGWAVVNHFRINGLKSQVAELKTEEKDAKIVSDVHALSDDDIDKRIVANLTAKPDR
jgi:hypothetical protein